MRWRFHVDVFRAWAARVLYGWACRIAGRSLVFPTEPEFQEEFQRMHAQRMERIAREWKGRHDELRRRHIEERRARTVEF